MLGTIKKFKLIKNIISCHKNRLRLNRKRGDFIQLLINFWQSNFYRLWNFRLYKPNIIKMSIYFVIIVRKKRLKFNNMYWACE